MCWPTGKAVAAARTLVSLQLRPSTCDRTRCTYVAATPNRHSNDAFDIRRHMRRDFLPEVFPTPAQRDGQVS